MTHCLWATFAQSERRKDSLWEPDKGVHILIAAEDSTNTIRFYFIALVKRFPNFLSKKPNIELYTIERLVITLHTLRDNFKIYYTRFSLRIQVL